MQCACDREAKTGRHGISDSRGSFTPHRQVDVGHAGLVVYDRRQLTVSFQLIELVHKAFNAFRADIAAVVAIDDDPPLDIQDKQGANHGCSRPELPAVDCKRPLFQSHRHHRIL
eukprot:199091-Chlamydomonas_euryale.AAC.6